MVYILLVLFGLAIVVVLIDAAPAFLTWQSRIHIGRYPNSAVWQNRVLLTAQNWLKRSPTIKMTDQNRLMFLDMLRGNYRKKTVQSWQEGALILGMSQYVKATQDQKVRGEVEEFVAEKMTSEGKWKTKPSTTDEALMAYAVLQMEFISPHQYKAAFDETYQMILGLKGADGTVAYRSHVTQYRFVDTVGFISPFLVCYGHTFKVEAAIELGLKQLTEYRKYGMMAQENIPFHTYQVESKIPVGLAGWGRGLGWYVTGLADAWQELPADHPQKKSLEKLVIEAAKSAFKYQEENGGFHWLLFDRGSRLDSSTVAALAWFLTCAATIPEIEHACEKAKEKCLFYLQSVTRRDGAIDFSQGDTKGIGVYSQNFDILPFTQGFVLRTLSSIK